MLVSWLHKHNHCNYWGSRPRVEEVVTVVVITEIVNTDRSNRPAPASCRHAAAVPGPGVTLNCTAEAGVQGLLSDGASMD